MIYRAMFAIITPALISGATERMSLILFPICAAVVNVDLLPTFARWYGQAWISRLRRWIGALILLVGTVVHISSGAS